VSTVAGCRSKAALMTCFTLDTGDATYISNSRRGVGSLYPLQHLRSRDSRGNAVNRSIIRSWTARSRPLSLGSLDAPNFCCRPGLDTSAGNIFLAG